MKPLEALEIIKKYCSFGRNPFSDDVIQNNKLLDTIETALKALEIMATILHYSYNNRFIVKQAFDEGWINEDQYQLMIATFGYYNCTGKEKPNESTN